MQKANLSYNNLQDCLQQLQQLELIELHPDASYVTTMKGKTFIMKWNQLQEFLEPEEGISIKAKKGFS